MNWLKKKIIQTSNLSDCKKVFNDNFIVLEILEKSKNFTHSTIIYHIHSYIRKNVFTFRNVCSEVYTESAHIFSSKKKIWILLIYELTLIFFPVIFTFFLFTNLEAFPKEIYQLTRSFENVSPCIPFEIITINLNYLILL